MFKSLVNVPSPCWQQWGEAPVFKYFSDESLKQLYCLSCCIIFAILCHYRNDRALILHLFVHGCARQALKLCLDGENKQASKVGLKLFLFCLRLTIPHLVSWPGDCERQAES